MSLGECYVTFRRILLPSSSASSSSRRTELFFLDCLTLKTKGEITLTPKHKVTTYETRVFRNADAINWSLALLDTTAGDADWTAASCNERAVVYFNASFDSLTEKDTLIYEVPAVNIFVFKVSGTLISQHFCLPGRKLSIKSVNTHLMIITSFIILMLHDLKIQPVSNTVKHLHVWNYKWLVFVGNKDDWCSFIFITYDEASFHTKCFFSNNITQHTWCLH